MVLTRLTYKKLYFCNMYFAIYWNC